MSVEVGLLAFIPRFENGFIPGLSEFVRVRVYMLPTMFNSYTEVFAENYGVADGKAQRVHTHMREEEVQMQDMPNAWEVVRAVRFLVSGEASYITKQKIVVIRVVHDSPRLTFGESCCEKRRTMH